ncbi:MAG: rubrerythrin family protein [Holosporales bacterium]|jgi:rubrerythrin|nr:rubrerythrin family protein [Holosporales bacterium]
MNLRGSNTEKNLLEAFSGESQARNKYSYFASQARKEGYEQIGQIFDEIAANEKEHAKIWFKLLNGGSISQTTDNLRAAMEGEEFEYQQMYPNFASEAEKEGFNEIAELFRSVAAIEKTHKEEYELLLDNILHNKVFVRDDKVTWKCRNCGYEITDTRAPTGACPVCKHGVAYFELKKSNY